MARRSQPILGASKFMLVVGLMAGCQEPAPHAKHQDDLVMPAPNGSFVHKFEEVQAGKAKASAYVFFLDEWYMGGTFLGPHGSRHFEALLPALAATNYPVRIQPDPDPELNEKRRLVIVNALLKEGIAGANERVLVAFPRALGLNGEESERIYREMLLPPRNNSGYGTGLGIQNGSFGGGFGQGGGQYGGQGGGQYGGGQYGGGQYGGGQYGGMPR